MAEDLAGLTGAQRERWSTVRVLPSHRFPAVAVRRDVRESILQLWCLPNQCITFATRHHNCKIVPGSAARSTILRLCTVQKGRKHP
jgi:hypothetical protein